MGKNDLPQTPGADAVKKAIDGAQAPGQVPLVTKRQWLAPLPIESQLPPAPVFGAAALLPKTLKNFVLDEADRMPCSPDYIAAALLVCLGSVIGASCAIKPKRRDDWIVVPNLWGGVIGDPSSKKTPALGVVTRFLDRLEAKEAERLEGDKKVYEAELAAFEAHQGAVKASMKKAAGGKGDGLKMQAAVSDLAAMVPPTEPHERRFKSNDPTIEKLGELNQQNPKGLAVIRDELTGLLASWEKSGHEQDKAFYLEAWNGTSSFSIDRITRGSLRVPNLCLSIFGGIQPELMERYLSGIVEGFGNDGGIQRFQVMVYPDATPWQWVDRYPVQGAREAVRDLFDRLAAFDPVQDGATPANDFVKLPHFQFDDEAQELFIEWATDLHKVKIAGEQNPMLQQHLAKFEKLFCSIALILNMADGQIGPVNYDSAMRAVAWCDYLEDHARRVYGLLEASRVTAAKTLARRLVEGKLENGFTARDVYRKQWAGLSTRPAIDGALAILEANHWVFGYDNAGDNGGRPTTVYHVNPGAKGAKP